MSDPAPGAPGARPRHPVVVDVAVAGGRLVLGVPLSVVQVGPAVWDVASRRVRLVLPQQLRLDVGDGVLLLLPGGVRRRSWETLLVLLHPQVVWIATS